MARRLDPPRALRRDRPHREGDGPGERPAFTDGLVHLHLRCNHAAEVADRDAFRFDAHRFQDVELFLGALPIRGVREDGKVRRQMRPADGSEHLPLVWRDFVRGAHFPERTQGIRRRIPDELLRNLYPRSSSRSRVDTFHPCSSRHWCSRWSLPPWSGCRPVTTQTQPPPLAPRDMAMTMSKE